MTRVTKLEAPHLEKLQRLFPNKSNVEEWNWEKKSIIQKNPK
jgi:hypothetical protein